MVWIKHLIAGHHCDQILCVRQVDNFMRPSWNHINRFNAIYADKKNTWIKTGLRTGFHPSSRRTAYDGKVWKRKSGDGIRDSTHQSRIPKIPPPQIHSSPQKAEVTEENAKPTLGIAPNVYATKTSSTWFSGGFSFSKICDVSPWHFLATKIKSIRDLLF